MSKYVFKLICYVVACQFFINESYVLSILFTIIASTNLTLTITENNKKETVTLLEFIKRHINHKGRI